MTGYKEALRTFASDTTISTLRGSTDALRDHGTVQVLGFCYEKRPLQVALDFEKFWDKQDAEHAASAAAAAAAADAAAQAEGAAKV